MTKIYNNLTVTDRMLNKLGRDRYFGVDDLSDLDNIIPMIAWLLWVRAKDNSGEVRIVKGPHYQYTSVKIRDAMTVPRGRFFQIRSGVICATFSKDLEYDEAKEYTVDINNGEIYVYPAFIDSIGFPFPK
jgi:hypothetical protein